MPEISRDAIERHLKAQLRESWRKHMARQLLQTTKCMAYYGAKVKNQLTNQISFQIIWHIDRFHRMIQGYGPVTQALLGTLLTWGLTALGAGLVVFLRGNQRKTLDTALGFAAGVMIAASFWSLLAPAIELAENSGTYGNKGEFSFIPVAAGFLMGAIFVYGCDKVICYLGINSSAMMIALTNNNKNKAEIAMEDQSLVENGRRKFLLCWLTLCFWPLSTLFDRLLVGSAVTKAL